MSRWQTSKAVPRSRALALCYLLTIALAGCGLMIVWSAFGPAYVRIVELVSFVSCLTAIAFAWRKGTACDELGCGEWVCLVVLVAYVVASAGVAWFLGEHRDVRIVAYDFQLMLLVPVGALLTCTRIDFRVIDRILAGAIAIFSVLYVILIRYAGDADVERSLFTISVLGFVGQIVGLAPILLFKYVPRFSWITIVAMVGVAAQGYGAYVGAYRGGVILFGVAIAFSAVQSFACGKSVSIFWRIGFILGLLMLAGVSLSLRNTDSGEWDALVRRFSMLQSGNGGVGGDARYYEAEYYWDISTMSQILFGRGVGGHWYDYVGMYDYDKVSAGWRPIMHINYMHYVLKIGFIGSALTVALIGSMIWRRRKMVTFAFTLSALYIILLNLYYGPKSFNVYSLHMVLVLMVPSYFEVNRVGLKSNYLSWVERRRTLFRGGLYS